MIHRATVQKRYASKQTTMPEMIKELLHPVAEAVETVEEFEQRYEHTKDYVKSPSERRNPIGEIGEDLIEWAFRKLLEKLSPSRVPRLL